ncbi:MAG: alpha/beta fold hydrolase [Verrucomicrobiales bacterium]|nr:alpha/beta fold hydrolase [Verrucomicrobiales bacterium]
MSSLLPRLEFGASIDDAEMTVILMHGLGADGYDFADVADAMTKAAENRRWRFVLPHAPEIPVTVNMGMVMPAWYDIIDMSQPRNVDWETVATSTAQIDALIEAESAEKIILAGFSQGGAMALHVGLRRQKKIAGILAMSGYLLESESHPCPDKEVDLPIAIFHGSADPVVPLVAAEFSIKTLQEKGFSLTSQIYPGLEHSLFEKEIQDVFAWLEER